MIFVTYPLMWTQEVVDKIWQKHHVSADEVEEAMFDDSPAGSKGAAGSYWVYGQTVSGRYLFIVLRKREGKGRYKVITARDMEESERKYYGKRQK